MVSQTFLATALPQSSWPFILATSPLHQNLLIMLAPLLFGVSTAIIFAVIQRLMETRFVVLSP
jgi:hypothetical protein